MLEELKDMIDKPAQQMKQQQIAAQAARMGSIHYMITRKNKDDLIELQWNVYYGNQITPELIKKELEKWSKIIKQEVKK